MLMSSSQVQELKSSQVQELNSSHFPANQHKSESLVCRMAAGRASFLQQVVRNHM
jgi:hypothetical protein